MTGRGEADPTGTSDAWTPCGSCGHFMLLHDIEDYDDPRPMCCVTDCRCAGDGGQQ